MQRNTKINKKRHGVVTLHDDSDCNKTQIIRNFHLYIKQLWKPFFDIFHDEPQAVKFLSRNLIS